MQGKKKVILVIMFLLFLGVMDYPFLARIINDRIQGTVVTDYEKQTESMETDRIEALLESARAYNRGLAESDALIKDMLSGATGDKDYRAQLQVDDSGVMGTIEIPKIGVDLPIYHSTDEEALQKGAGHLEGTSLPVGGESTHTCISAHRGLPRKELFTNLDAMKIGDVFYLKVLGEVLAYEVYEIETVRPPSVDMLAIQEGKDIATLITCTPYGINSHRIFVHGKRISYTPEEEAIVLPEPEGLLRQYWWVLLNVVLILWLLFLLYKTRDKSGKT